MLVKPMVRPRRGRTSAARRLSGGRTRLDTTHRHSCRRSDRYIQTTFRRQRGRLSKPGLLPMPTESCTRSPVISSSSVELQAPTARRMECCAPVETDPLKKLQERLHIIEGLIAAMERWSEICDVVAASEDQTTARQALCRPPFSFSEAQAQHVLDTPVARRTALGRRQLAEERDRTVAAIDGLAAED